MRVGKGNTASDEYIIIILFFYIARDNNSIAKENK